MDRQTRTGRCDRSFIRRYDARYLCGMYPPGRFTTFYAPWSTTTGCHVPRRRDRWRAGGTWQILLTLVPPVCSRRTRPFDIGARGQRV